MLSEAVFLLGSARGVEKLVGLAFDLRAEWSAVATLLRKYGDVPMSLADACLVRMAELHREARVSTLDGDFAVYRRNRRQVIPLICPD